MREWLAKLQPSLTKKNLLVAAILVGVGVGAFFWGRHNASATSVTPPDLQGGPGSPEGYRGNRIVAYVYNQPVFREELGEYLIARFGAERLEFLTNRKIVEMECKKHNISVSDSDVEIRFEQDLRSFGPQMTASTFETSVLKRFNKTLYEWKEDVIRPKIMMERLVGASVVITDKDLREGFEARYGPKVECRMIVIAKENRSVVEKVWRDVSKNREAFIAAAKTQFIPNLAGAEGRVPPIHKHFGDKELEDAAFRLKEGEVSGHIQMKDGTFVILLCERHLPKNELVRFEDERHKISKEMHELRVAQKIPEVFLKLKEAANPQLLLKNEGSMVSIRSEPMPKLKVEGGAPVQMPGKVAPLTTAPPK